MFTRKEYFDNYKNLLLAAELQPSDVSLKLEESFESELADGRVEMSTINKWANAYNTIPPPGACAVIAKAIGTSVGYLLGLHNCSIIKITSSDLNFNVRKIADEFKNESGISIYAANEIKSCKTWLQKHVNEASPKLSRLSPFVRFSEATGYCIDYILGLSDVKYWQEYAFENCAFEFLPAGSLIYIPSGIDFSEGFALITPDKKSAVRSSGRVLPLDVLVESGARLVKEFKTF